MVKQELELFEKGSGKISAEVINKGNDKNMKITRNVDFNEFLVNKHETAVGKYGDVLNKVIEVTL